MKLVKSLALLIFTISPLSTAEILRLAKVVEKPSKGVTEMEFSRGDETETLFVEDKAIISEMDIALATPSLQTDQAVDITLTPGGTEKMITATTPMRPGIDRIAIILNGKVKSAPTIQSVPLGKYFVINGLTHEDEPKRLAGLLSGKAIEQIDQETKELEERLKKLPPLPKPVYYTEEEYQELATQRKKIGLNYIDRLYTEAELDALLTQGMTREDVIAIFGRPNSISETIKGRQTLTFETAPEKLPLEQEMRMLSFKTDFQANRLTEWGSYIIGKRTRATKQITPGPRNLIIKTPPADMSSADFDFISFLENHEISLKPGKTEPTNKELLDLAEWIWSLSQGENLQSIDPKCDLIRILRRHIPELEKISEKSNDSRIPLAGIEKVVRPYILGDKEFN